MTRLVGFLLLALPLLARNDPPLASSAALEQRLRAHVTFLADDLLEGRAAGTRGHQLAMAYVTAHHARLGLEPAGTQGFLQPMRFRESKLNLESGRFVIRQGSSETSLTPIAETIVRPAAATPTADVSATAVFVGFGIHAPEFNYDDFATGIEVRGHIAVILAGSPAQLPATARAHYARSRPESGDDFGFSH